MLLPECDPFSLCLCVPVYLMSCVPNVSTLGTQLLFFMVGFDAHPTCLLPSVHSLRGSSGDWIVAFISVVSLSQCASVNGRTPHDTRGDEKVNVNTML